MTLWGFSGYNNITTVPVKTPMHYYWDSSHFTEEVGDFILDRFFSMSSSQTPQNFGTKITPKNIELFLNKMRKNKQVYNDTYIDKVEELSLMYRDAYNGEKIDTTSLVGMF